MKEEINSEKIWPFHPYRKPRNTVDKNPAAQTWIFGTLFGTHHHWVSFGWNLP